MIRLSSRLVLAVMLIAANAVAAHADSTTTERIIGGTLAPSDDAVVLLNSGCTGTLIAPNVVLTAAHCMPSFGVQFGLYRASIFATRDAAEEIIARDYGVGLFSGGDIALIRLSSDAPPEVQPLPVNAQALTSDDVGRAVRLVGYGLDENGNSGVRRQVDVLIGHVDETFLTVGEEFYTACYGDSGGPAFLKIDGVEHVAGVTSFGAGGPCNSGVEYTRVDVYLSKLILEVVDAWSGPCRADGVCDTQLQCPGYADPDCDECGLQGICAAGCDDRDLDCPIGGADGASCDDREDCESLLCIESPEDPRVKFCSVPCDEANGVFCRGLLSECTLAIGPAGENVCTFDGPTPRTQGAQCLTGVQCRSGVCDPQGSICIEQCDAAGECPDGFECRAIGSQQACRLPQASGCQTGGRGSPLTGVLVLLALAGAFRWPKKLTSDLWAIPHSSKSSRNS